MTHATAPRKLPNFSAESIARIRNAIARRGSAYEIMISRGDEKYLFTYSPRFRTRSGLAAAVSSRAADLVAFTGSETITYAKKAADGATIGEWRLTWTGRTHVQALTEGTLPHFDDAICPVEFAAPVHAFTLATPARSITQPALF